LAVWILGGKGVVHEDKDKDKDKEEDKNKNKDKNMVVGHGRRILTSAADLGKGHEREIQIASSPHRRAQCARQTPCDTAVRPSIGRSADR
jgi:hypothetical protein